MAENILNSTPSNEGVIQTNVENPQGGQALTPEQLAQMEADKLALQSEYTRTRQALIEYAAKVASDNPSSLTEMKDTKLRNSVVKQLYGFDTYEQAVAVLGSELNANDGNNSDDRTSALERELKLLKYNSQKSTIENEIRNYKLSNPQYFTSNDAEEKLLQELQYISGDLPITERIKRAAAISLVPLVDPTTLAYKTILSNNIGSGGGGGRIGSIIQDTGAESEKQKQIEAGRKLLGLK